MTILESDWLVFGFEDPLWGDELLSRLTSWLVISYFLSPCMSRSLLWSAGILRYYILNDNMVGTFDANSFTALLSFHPSRHPHLHQSTHPHSLCLHPSRTHHQIPQGHCCSRLSYSLLFPSLIQLLSLSSCLPSYQFVCYTYTRSKSYFSLLCINWFATPTLAANRPQPSL